MHHFYIYWILNWTNCLNWLGQNIFALLNWRLRRERKKKRRHPSLLSALWLADWNYSSHIKRRHWPGGWKCRRRVSLFINLPMLGLKQLRRTNDGMGGRWGSAVRGELPACRATLIDQSAYTCLSAAESGPEAKPLSKLLFYCFILKYAHSARLSNSHRRKE